MNSRADNSDIHKLLICLHTLDYTQHICIHRPPVFRYLNYYQTLFRHSPKIKMNEIKVKKELITFALQKLKPSFKSWYISEIFFRRTLKKSFILISVFHLVDIPFRERKTFQKNGCSGYDTKLYPVEKFHFERSGAASSAIFPDIMVRVFPMVIQVGVQS